MKINIKQIVRPNIVALKPYSSARDEFTGKEGIFLDANENPFGTLNRYPDPYQMKLKQKLSELKNIDSSNIFVGNGSDQVIDLAFRIFCTPSVDKALTFSPTYGMYDVSASINNIELIKVPLNEDFQINLDDLKSYFEDANLKLIFICSPNNPTGNSINKEAIEFILKNFKGIVIVDEAYIDFSERESLISLISKYNNLIVSQTFSKAWGLASVRVGTAYTNPEIIAFYNKVKPPYNVSTINQEAAFKALNNYEGFTKNVASLLSEKQRLISVLETLSIVKKVYASDANFVLIEVDNANKRYQDLVNQNIIIRNRSSHVDNALRITVGTVEENNALLEKLKQFSV